MVCSEFLMRDDRNFLINPLLNAWIKSLRLKDVKTVVVRSISWLCDLSPTLFSEFTGCLWRSVSKTVLSEPFSEYLAKFYFH